LLKAQQKDASALARMTVPRDFAAGVVMAFLIAIVAGLIGAAAGWAAGNALESVTADVRAMLPDIDLLRRAVDVINPQVIGIGAGLLIPAWLTFRLYGGHRTVPALAWRSLVVVAAVVGFGAATLRVGAVVFDQFGMNAGAPQVAFEIRLPPGAKPPANPADLQIEFQTDKNQMIVSAPDVLREGERMVLRGSVPILFRTKERIIVLSLPGEPVRMFKLRLSEAPARHGNFGPWQEAELAGRTQRDLADIAIRYRVY
jgi:hypothetical protein